MSKDSRELVRKAIRREDPAGLPKGELCINDAVIRQTLNVNSVGFSERLAFIESLGLDIFVIPPDYPQVHRKLPDSGDYIWPDIDKWTAQTSLFTFAIVDGAFEVGMRTLDYVEFLTLSRTSPLSLKEFVVQVEKLNMTLFRDLAEKGIDGIIIADDIAYQMGLFIAPETLRKYFFPSLARQVEAIAQMGVNVFYHSDGNYNKVVQDIVNIGFQGVHCIDNNCGMNINNLQRDFGNKLCFWGHLDCTDTKQVHNPEYLQKLVDSIRKISLGNGFILGTTSGLFEDMDILGLKAIYRAVT